MLDQTTAWRVTRVNKERSFFLEKKKERYSFALQVGRGLFEQQFVDLGSFLVLFDHVLDALELFMLCISDKLE